jgi:50S ribosomal subunit-associated GTPase HflX
LGAVPAVLLINKVDLVEDWELDDGTIAELTDSYRAVYRTSAKNGEGVEEAFQTLAKAVATGPSSG